MRHPAREGTLAPLTTAHGSQVDVVIVGAGPAGLAAACELQRRGLRIRMIDGADQVGEPWRRRHDALRLNTHRWCSSLPGLRIPSSAGAYPSRDAFVEYLERYERFLGVAIDWGVRVTAIDRDPVSQDGWVVQTSRGTMHARDVVLATGPDRVPRMPAWPGAAEFRGVLMHAGAFGRPTDYDGKRVLIVGGGNSGVDIANCLARGESRGLWMSVRSGSTVVPRRLYGVPLQLLAVALRRSPRWYQDATTTLTSRLSFGKLDAYDLPLPSKGPFTRFVEDGVATAIDDGCVAALRGGRLRIVPEIACFDGAEVRFVDGTALAPDVVIAATGYRTGLEPLVGRFGVLDALGRPRVVGGPSSAAGLWFVGQRSNFHGNLHARGIEARGLARGVVRRRQASAGTKRAWWRRVRPARRGMGAPEATY